MKSKTALLLLGLIMVLCLTLSTYCKPCEEKEWDTLPPETQKGANTFGCYVNGELFVHRIGITFVGPSLAADYGNKILYIHALSEDLKYHIYLQINNPKENEYNLLTEGYLDMHKVEYGCSAFECRDYDRGVFITKFDTVNRIVSGTFEFLGECERIIVGEKPTIRNEDSTVQITQGRFDIKLELSSSDY